MVSVVRALAGDGVVWCFTCCGVTGIVHTADIYRVSGFQVYVIGVLPPPPPVPYRPVPFRYVPPLLPAICCVFSLFLDGINRQVLGKAPAPIARVMLNGEIFICVSILVRFLSYEVRE